MSDKTIILCPGQGAQHVGMGKSWAEKSEAARAIFAEADQVVGESLSELCFNGPEERVNGTDIAQAAIYTSSVACLRALEAEGVHDPATVVATAGLSLGEYTALHLAGVFSFADGLRLVWQRGRFMQDAADASQSSMVAVTGEVTEEKINELCDQARGSGVLVPANFNSPMQVVVSGSVDACERAVTVGEQMGFRTTALTVAGAFHSPIMLPAAERMAEALAAVEFATPRCLVMSNVTGEPHGSDTAQIKQLLVEQITSPVRWSQNCLWLAANVSGSYIEPAPGKVLAGLMRRIDRAIKVSNYAEAG